MLSAAVIECNLQVTRARRRRVASESGCGFRHPVTLREGLSDAIFPLVFTLVARYPMELRVDPEEESVNGGGIDAPLSLH